MNFEDVATTKRESKIFFISNEDGRSIECTEKTFDRAFLNYVDDVLGEYHVVRRHTMETLLRLVP